MKWTSMSQKKCIFKIVLQYLKLYKKIKTYLQCEKAMIQKKQQKWVIDDSDSKGKLLNLFF